MPSPAPAVSAGTSRDLKIVFTGPMGAGKTTAIRAISDGEVLSTDVPITGGAELSMPGKTMTTVGLDYGECRLGDQWVLKLFGTPGQERFRFMWDILGAGAFGLIVLADNSQPDPVGEVARYLKAFAPHVPARRTVVGVVLLHQRSKLPVREVWSDPITGEFAFNGIDTSQEFLTLAEDAAGNFRPVAASRLVPEVAP